MALRDIASSTNVTGPMGRRRAPAAEAAPASGPDLPIDALTLTGIVPLPVGPQAPFAYRGVKLPDVAKLGGVAANTVITRGYHDLDQAFSQYLGEPAVANWLTFGKYASREAGVQIADLESALGAMQFDGAAIKQTVKGLGRWQRLEQGAKLMLTEGRHLADRLTKADTLREKATSLNFPGMMAGDLTKLHAALVAGNKNVYQHIAPAFDLYMKTEAAGEDGLAALEKAGFGQGAKDPQGFVLQAFALYKDARALRARLADPNLGSHERLELTVRRQAMIGRANLLMVVNEQWTIVQSPTIFGDPDIARLTRAMEGAMTITDAMGEHSLLPDGGNWTDFTTRMGFKSMPPGVVPEAIAIVDERGVRRDFVPKNFERREGTIYTYFDQALSEDASRKMIDSAPAPIPGVVTSRR